MSYLFSLPGNLQFVQLRPILGRVGIVSYWHYDHQSQLIFFLGVGSYFLLIRWQMLLNFLIASFVVILIIVPWEIGQNTCENFNLTILEPPQSVLDGCNRPNNLSVCDPECTTRSDTCWLEYRSSVMTTISNHSYDALLLIQVQLFLSNLFIPAL